MDDKRGAFFQIPIRYPSLTIHPQLLQIIGGLSRAGLKIVGSDVVEFTPVYDNTAETTGIAVGEIIYEILQWMVHVPVVPRKSL